MHYLVLSSNDFVSWQACYVIKCIKVYDKQFVLSYNTDIRNKNSNRIPPCFIPHQRCNETDCKRKQIKYKKKQCNTVNAIICSFRWDI